MSRNILFRIVIISISIILIIFGCKEDSGNGTEPDIAEGYINDAWEKFENGDYTGAIEDFEYVIAEFNTYDDHANAGIGWCYAFIAKGNGPEDPNYTTAMSYFNLASDITEALAGRCLVNNVLNNYQDAVDDGKAVIAANINYEFQGDSQIGIILVRLVVAESAFYLGNYAEVVTQLDIIDPGVTHNTNDPDGLLERIQDFLSP